MVWVKIVAGSTILNLIFINGNRCNFLLRCIKHLNYDFSNNELKIAMPFDWNFDRLKKVNLYVHEEISIPTPSPLALSGYNGTINNIDLKPNSLLVYRTNSSKDVVHIMLTKHTVMDLAQKVGENNIIILIIILILERFKIIKLSQMK